MGPTRSDQSWHIATNLLSQVPTLWSNLGLWAPADLLHPKDHLSAKAEDLAYISACKALASRIGAAAKLSPGMDILDLGCGFGASIDHWVETFGVSRVDVMDIRAYCIKAITERQPRGLGRAVTGSVAHMSDLISSHGPLSEASYDGVVSVDAAYHFGDLPKLFSAVSKLLRPKGIFAWTTLVLDPSFSPSIMGMPWFHFLLSLARIPSSSLFSVEQTKSLLNEKGLELVDSTNLNIEVLEGFSKHVAKRKHALSRKARFSRDWIKIQGTAHMAQKILVDGLIHYQLLAAQQR